MKRCAAVDDAVGPGLAAAGHDRFAGPVPRLRHRTADQPAARSPRAGRLPSSTTSDAGGSRRPWAGEAIVRTSSTAAVGCCAEASSLSTSAQWTRLELTLSVGGPSGQLTQAWMVAQELQLLYARSHDLTDARRRLWRIFDRCARSDVTELLRLARTLDAWTDELLVYWTLTGRRGVSNGPTEAINALTKKVKRVGHGVRNFDNYRLRLLLGVGLDWRTVHWQAAPSTPIRARSPRLVA
jgi:hypothetical protein